jgi:hypothetical protein
MPVVSVYGPCLSPWPPASGSAIQIEPSTQRLATNETETGRRRKPVPVQRGRASDALIRCAFYGSGSALTPTVSITRVIAFVIPHGIPVPRWRHLRRMRLARRFARLPLSDQTRIGPSAPEAFTSRLSAGSCSSCRRRSTGGGARIRGAGSAPGKAVGDFCRGAVQGPCRDVYSG